MAQGFARFAFASPSSSTVSFFDHSAWITYARDFPDDIGSLVESGGDLLFFVKLMDEPSEVADAPATKWVRVGTWNPFTEDIEYFPRPPSITSLPFLVRMLPLFDNQELEGAMGSSLEQPPYSKYKYLPPMQAYIFTMVGRNHEGKKVMESFYWDSDTTKRHWHWTTPRCDHWTIRDVSDNGLYQPSMVFRQTDAGALVKFDAPKEFIEAIPHPDIKRDHFAKLDDPLSFVILLPASESLPTEYFLAVEQHESRDYYAVKHSSPKIELHDAGACETYVYGAKSGAIVVQHVPRLESLEFDIKIHLHLFDSSFWNRFEGFSEEFQKGDFIRALLCQTTSAFPLLDFGRVDGASTSRRSIVPSIRA